MNFNGSNLTVYSCKFEATIKSAKVQIKFPCTYFLQWKTNNAKTIVSSQNRHEAIKSQINFNQTLCIAANVLFDKAQKKYIKKDSLLLLNLISKSRPDQIKLVGRVSIDLSDVINEGLFADYEEARLQYCSVQSSIILSIRIAEIKQSTLNVSDLDRSSFNQYMSLNAGKKVSPQYVQIERLDGSSTSRQFQQVKVGRLSQTNQIRSLDQRQKQKNKMSSSSLTKVNLAMTNEKNINMTSTMKQRQFPPIDLKQNNNRFRHQRQDSISYSERQAPIRKIQAQDSISGLKPKKSQKQQNSNNTSKSKNIDHTNDPNFSFDKNQLSDKEIHVSSPQYSSAKKYSTSNNNNNNNNNNFSANDDTASLTKRLQNRQTELYMVKENSANLREEYLQKMKEYQLKQMDYERKEMQIRKLESDNLGKQKKIQELTTQLRSFKEMNSEKASTQTQKTTQLNKKILKLTQTISQWQQKYSNTTFQTEQVRTQWKKQREQLNIKISKLTQNLQSRQKQLKQSLKSIESLKLSRQKLQKQNYDRCQQNSLLSSQIANKSEQLQEMTTRYQSILQMSKSQQSTIEQLRQIKQKRQKELSSQSQNRISNAKEEIDFLNNQISQAKQNGQNVQYKLTSAKDEVKILQTKSQELTLELLKANQLKLTLTKQLQEYKNQIQTIKAAQNDLVTQTLANSNQIFQQKQAEFASYKETKQRQILQFNSLKQNLQNTIININEQVQAYQTTIKSLESDITFFQQSAQEKQEAVKQKDETILNLDRQLQEITQSFMNKQNQVMVLVAENQDYHSSVKSMKVAMEILQAKNIQLQDLVIKAAQQKDQELQQQKQKFQEQLLNADIKLSQVQNQSQELRKQLEQLHQRQSEDVIKSTQTIRRFTYLINQKQGIIQVLQRKVIQQAGKNRNMEEKIEKIVKKQEQLKASLDLLQQASHQFYLNLQQKQKYTKNLQQKLKTTQQNLENTSKQLAQRQEKLIQHLQSIQQQKKQIQQRQSVILIIEERSQKDLEQHKQKSTKQLNELLQKIQYQRQSIGGLQFLVNEKVRANEDLKQINLQIQSNISNLENRLNQYHFSLEDTKKEKQELQNKIRDKQQVILGLQQLKLSVISKKQTENRQNQSKIQELTQELITQKQQFNNLLNQQIKFQQNSTLQQQNMKRTHEQQKVSLQQNILKMQAECQQKSHFIQILQQEKAKASTQLEQLRQIFDELKTDRQTYAAMNFKQELSKKQQQIKNLQQQIKQLKSQTAKIKQLQRNLKIKTIQLSSLKYKSNSSQTGGNYSQIQQIVKLKNQQIQSLKEQNQRIKELQSQLGQIEKLNQQLYENIEQLEQEKFNFCSQQNQRDICIVELKEQILQLSSSLKEYAQRNDEYLHKVNEYEGLIQELYKQKEGSTRSPSQKLTNSRHSQIVHQISQKNIQAENNKKDQTIQNLTLQNIQLVDQIEQLKQKEGEYRNNLQNLQLPLKDKEEELLKKSRKSQELILKSLPNGPLDLETSCKQIQKILSSRTEFYDIQKNLLQLFNQKCRSVDFNKQIHSTLNIFHQKSKQLSKQFQLVKAKIMKSQGRNYQQKAKLITLLKPCQDNIKQILKITDQSA